MPLGSLRDRSMTTDPKESVREQVSRRSRLVRGSIVRRAPAEGRRSAHERGRRSATPPSRLDRLIAAATVDANGESEQRAAFLCMIEDSLKVPFETMVLGVRVLVERISSTADDEIVAICRRGRYHQALPILALSLPA